MRHLTTTVGPRGVKVLAASGAMMVALTGLTACSDSAGPEAGEVTTEDLTSLQDEVAALEERVGTVEAQVGSEAEGAAGDEQPEVVGQDVTVSAEVTEMITSNDSGTAFRIGGADGPSVAVLTGSPPQGLEVDDVVQISGVVQMVNRDTFEQDFGIAEDALFDDPDAFFDSVEGQPAIKAQEIEVLQEQSDG